MAIRKRLDSAIVDVWKREVGDLSTRKFVHRRAATEDLVLRLDILRKLDKHVGCVNTISFNASGDILVSGSDDKRVILWDWETGQVNLSFYSGHEDNVFQAKFMPYTDDRSIVTCAADGQVRHAQILERGGVETKLLAKHQERAHKLAIEPGSPHIFYTCGEDGLVQHIDLRTGTATGLFTCKPVPGQSYFPTVRLNTIAIDPRNPNLFAVGGTDQFARLFDIRQYKWDGSSEFGRPVDLFCAPHLIEDDNVGITGLSFSEQSELLVSYNNEFIYMFTKDIGLGPEPNLTPQVSDSSQAGDDVKAAPQDYKGHKNFDTVKGVGFFGPNCDYVVSGSDCGRIFIWKKKGGELVRVMEADKHIVNCIEAHPHATVLASSGIEHDIKIWTPKATERATLPTNIQKVCDHFEYKPLLPCDFVLLICKSRSNV
ncbi:ddb1- and cul4-associated factor 8 [Phtheirospermum japonicum]|uniref:Ddb1-and cul4-associated factor 8 n=1 Tax=Phtheirospermum japonicum TaxID=374723 RepID=A0A830BNB8_9LAMI|nr:ddb1- and cul4-associated factor 8 [Phtheirospermum japonicum]